MLKFLASVFCYRSIFAPPIKYYEKIVLRYKKSRREDERPAAAIKRRRFIL